MAYVQNAYGCAKKLLVGVTALGFGVQRMV